MQFSVWCCCTWGTSISEPSAFCKKRNAGWFACRNKSYNGCILSKVYNSFNKKSCYLPIFDKTTRFTWIKLGTMMDIRSGTGEKRIPRNWYFYQARTGCRSIHSVSVWFRFPDDVQTFVLGIIRHAMAYLHTFAWRICADPYTIIICMFQGEKPFRALPEEPIWSWQNRDVILFAFKF